MLFARLLESAAVLYTRLTEDAHMDCYFDEARPSHEENVYMPEKSRGGTQLCLVSVRQQPVRITELMPVVEGQWNCRAHFPVPMYVSDVVSSSLASLDLSAQACIYILYACLPLVGD